MTWLRARSSGRSHAHRKNFRRPRAAIRPARLVSPRLCAGGRGVRGKLRGRRGDRLGRQRRRRPQDGCRPLGGLSLSQLNGSVGRGHHSLHDVGGQRHLRDQFQHPYRPGSCRPGCSRRDLLAGIRAEREGGPAGAACPRPHGRPAGGPRGTLARGDLRLRCDRGGSVVNLAPLRRRS